MNIDESLLITLNTRLKASAQKLLQKGRIYDAILDLKAAALQAYTFNLGYADNEIEAFLIALSKKLHIISEPYSPAQKKCVVYDSFYGDGNRCLALQYIRALNALGWSILYVAERQDFTGSPLWRDIHELADLSICVLPKGVVGLKKSQFIYDAIVNYHPTHIFAQLLPQAVEPIVAFNALPSEIVKCQINLTDHTFWLGTSFLDYTLEFRPYGCKVSRDCRGIEESQIVYLPFYSISSKKPFLGFPEGCADKVVIFSGGSYYKVIDRDKTFFSLIKGILDRNPEAIVLFAGSGANEIFDPLTSDPKYATRFKLIGFREDIDEIVKHCDIYLNTFPVGGGLMCQYAARNGKPILNYHTPETSKVEDFVCQLKEISISSNSLNDFFDEASRLISNREYREYRGSQIQDCIIDESKFTENLGKWLETGGSLPFDYDNIEIRKFEIAPKIENENENLFYTVTFFKRLKIRRFFMMPKYTMYFISKLFTKRGLKATFKQLKK